MRGSVQFAVALAGCALAAAGAPVAAAPACPTTTDQSLYEVLALRQEMMLLATKCGDDQAYGSNFVKRFQPALQANDREVLGYFRGLYGRAGQTRMDTFTTDLASEMSHEANLQGAEFCPRAAWLFSEMNALRTNDELVQWAAAKDLPPAGMSMCPPGAARSAERSASRHR